jgi:hypothetical protein
MSSPLFLLPALLLAVAAASTKTAESLTVAPNCQASCGGVDIPYPFGIRSGCSRKGFEIDCINNGPVLAGTSLQGVLLPGARAPPILHSAEESVSWAYSFAAHLDRARIGRCLTAGSS